MRFRFVVSSSAFQKTLPENAPKAERIASSIQDLEDVSERQNGQPGGVDLGWSPVVKALVKEGEDAVEPLLDCLEKDHCLTRSVHFHHDFFRHRLVEHDSGSRVCNKSTGEIRPS